MSEVERVWCNFTGHHPSSGWCMTVPGWVPGWDYHVPLLPVPATDSRPSSGPASAGLEDGRVQQSDEADQ